MRKAARALELETALFAFGIGLIIDEVLSVGDEAFQKRCMELMRRFREHVVTILYISHALDSVHALCDYAAWIDQGRLRYFGESQRVVAICRASLQHVAHHVAPLTSDARWGRWGAGQAASRPA